jgi:hypothetical protein
MESQIRETRNANQTTASASLESDSGAPVGDNIDTYTVASRNEANEAMKAQIHASRNADSAIPLLSLIHSSQAATWNQGCLFPVHRLP